MNRVSKLFPLLATSIVISAADRATASDCLAEVRALWDEGAPLDAFQRPPHENTNTVRDANGTVTEIYDSIIETPLRTIAGIRGTHMTLAIDNDVWTGPGVNGPWTPQQGFTGDRRAQYNADRLQRQANLTDAACHGTVDVEGASYLSYSFTTKSDPDEEMGGLWYGSSDTVYIDPGTRQVMIWEMGNFVSSWAPAPTGEHHRVVFTYDPSIKILRPG
ncbi:hypothetical protein [Roseovarius indicus]|uniref:hypothetical protein n=1 Tax=Roseovarius indicus TaxID=540747 RepID=UPI000ABD82F3|nr:hypothetical protein [Roseovarius indicus]